MSAPESTPDLAPAERPLLPRFGAEILGTFILVLIGFGTLLYAGVTSTPDDGAKLLAWGAGAIAGIAVIGHVSGGHLNPAVSLGAAITGRISWADLLPYWVAQLIGATGAAALLFVTIPGGLPAAVGQASTRAMFTPLAGGVGQNSVLGQLSDGAVSTDLVPTLLVEAVATALFVAIALAAGRTLRRGALGAPVVIGLAYAGLSVATYTLTGGALNPARAAAAAIFAEPGALGDLWLFWVAPLFGAALAAMLYTVFAPEPLAAGAEWDDEDDEDEEWDEDDTLEDDPAEGLTGDETAEPATAEDAEHPTDAEAAPDRDDAFTEDFDVATLDDADLEPAQEPGPETSQDDEGEEPEEEPRRS